MLKRINGKNKVLINASAPIRERVWYKATVRISGNQIIAKIYDENGNILRGLVAIDNDLNTAGEYGVFTEGDLNTLFAIKNLEVEVLDNFIPAAEGNQTPFDAPNLLALCLALLTSLIAITFIASYVKKGNLLNG